MTQKPDDELKQMVYEYVEEKGGVTFVELERLLSDEIEVEGDVALHSDTDPNILFWMNSSERFQKLVTEMLAGDRLTMDPTQPLVYHVDGKVPSMDVVKQPPSDGYKEPRWLPVQFNIPD